MAIYVPAEDSFLFAEFLENYLGSHQVKSYLDIGTGSGILSETALKFLKKENILATDIDSESVEFIKKKGLKVLQSNLFSKISKNKKFDLITFNAPYLPSKENEPNDSRRATTGGKKGDEISLKFLKQAKKHLAKNGKIFLLISSLTPMSKLKKLKPKIVVEKNLFFEKLLILQFQ
jgi:release factor glutamine methyltransferase